MRATQHPCSIVIKPTTGDFLKYINFVPQWNYYLIIDRFDQACSFLVYSDYFNSKDLHIGVTDSKGMVVEFDRGGLQQADAHLWKQCLVLDGAAGPWSDHWDSTLAHVAHQECWTAER